MKKGKLFYNEDNDRVGIIDSMDLWIEDGFHCGECFEIEVDGAWIKERIEMDINGVWYLVYSKLKGKDIDGTKVRIM